MKSSAARARFVARPGPVRHREHVVLRPVETVLANSRAAFPGDDEADGVVRAPGGARRALDSLEEQVQRRHDRAAVSAVAYGPRAVGPHGGGSKLLARLGPGKAVLRRPCVSHLPEALVLALARLEETRVERADGRHVGGVEPHRAPSALVDVAVPAHRRRQHQVALLHLAAAAVDDGDRALGARGEADRGGGVPVRHRLVAGLEHRKGADQVLGSDGRAVERRVREDQRAALDVLDRDFLGRALGERLDVAPAPVHRRVLRPRRERSDALVPVPQGMNVGALQCGDQRGIGSHRLSLNSPAAVTS